VKPDHVEGSLDQIGSVNWMGRHCRSVASGDPCALIPSLSLSATAGISRSCKALSLRDTSCIGRVPCSAFAHSTLDSDNDSTFMSQAVFDYCKGRSL
jgi:hypothetical protein